MSEKNKGAIIVLIRVFRTDCEIVNYIDSHLKNTTVKNLKMMNDFTLHCLIFNNGDENTDEVNEIKALSHSFFRAGKNRMWAECKSCTACNFFSTYNLVILGSIVTGNNAVLYRILLPGKIELKALQKELENNSIKYQIVEYYYKNSIELTEREKFVINKVYESKYFEKKRSSTLTDIAKSINISPSSLSETMRISLKKIIQNYIEENCD
ncbi:helix-turn-helix domain-containing protein [Ferroplasma sp.]|uniref:helix-turn-helix domain-containing protein n=1 Tax=Ferroplasma sp. TaxID=2591003 RepID=UPI00307EC76E